MWPPAGNWPGHSKPHFSLADSPLLTLTPSNRPLPSMTTQQTRHLDSLSENSVFFLLRMGSY